MKTPRILSILLALGLQTMPLCRVILTQAAPAMGTVTIIARWVAGAMVMLGAVHAVSGASTAITSPKTASGTNGLPFSYRITTGPEVANQFSAAPLPAGLTVSSTSGRISGTPTSNGTWSVLLTASDSGLPSRTVTATLSLTIVPGAAPVPPTITTQPQSQTATAGATVSFSVVATGSAPLSYQWRFGNGNVSGATGASLTLNSVTTSQSGNYSVVVSNAGGAVTSSVAALTVDAPVAPAITIQPQNQTVTAGGNVLFSVVATGSAPLNYQWRFGNADLAGETGTSLALNNIMTSQAGNYAVVVANAGGAVTSSVAVLTVNPLIIPPTITVPPQNQSVLAGGTATFSVVASGTAPLNYQWRLEGAALAGRTTPTLVLNNVSTNDAGNYSVTVSNSAGVVTSAAASLAVTPAPVAPFIVSQPQSQIVVAGTNAVLTVVVGGTAPLAYQWRYGNVAFAGQTSATLTLNNINTNQAGNYSVVITNIAGVVTSTPAMLTVNVPVLPPTISTQPQSQSVNSGSNATFSVIATGSAPLQYQWRFNGASLVNQTSAALALSNVTTNQTGSYAVVVSNPAGAVTSQVAVLTVLQSRPGGGPPSWPDYAGAYNGLLYDTNGVALGGSGFFTFALSKRGTYSASLQLSGGWRLSASGSLALDGRATNVIRRAGSTPVTVIWALALDGSEQIAGLGYSDIWTAELLGDHVRFNSKTNPCPYVGKYTFILPGVPAAGSSPEGDSYGAVTIDSNGVVSMKGALADQSAALQKTRISKSGDWPLFAPLYGKIGALLGWIHLENRAADDFHGNVSWVKPVAPTTPCYPQGFSMTTEMTGSLYSPAGSGTHILNWTTGSASITGSMLPQAYSLPVAFGAKDDLLGQSPGLITASFLSSSGFFAGRFQPSAGQPLIFRGAVLQKANAASGYFIRSNQSGRVEFR